MQKRVMLVSAAVAVLGLAATVLGFVAESANSKAFVGIDGQRCVYRRTPALGCGIAAALLALTGLAVATVASDEPAAGRRRAVAVKLYKTAWAAVAVVIFLYGVVMNRGGTRGISTGTRSWRSGHAHYYGCNVVWGGVFETASILSAIATGCAVAAYLYCQQTDEAAPGQFVAMGQPQSWAPQTYPPPPMADPAPSQYGHGGYGQRAGTA